MTRFGSHLALGRMLELQNHVLANPPGPLDLGSHI